jgi:hypothetical protein
MKKYHLATLSPSQKFVFLANENVAFIFAAESKLIFFQGKGKKVNKDFYQWNLSPLL